MSQLPADPLGLDPGAVGGPAPLRLVHARGDPPGRRGDGRDPRLPRVGRELLRPLRDSSPSGRHRVLVCTNISCWMNGADELLEAFCEAAGVDPTRPPTAARARPTASSSSAASSASAPATSRRWPRSTSATTGRSSTATRRRAIEPAALRRATSLPGQGACAKRRAAGGGPTPEPGPASGGGARCLRRGCSSATSTSPGSATIEAYRAPRRLPRARARRSREMEPERPAAASSRTRACAAAAAPASRWARRRSFLPRGEMDKYLCCNADESEPGHVQGPRADAARTRTS